MLDASVSAPPNHKPRASSADRWRGPVSNDARPPADSTRTAQLIHQRERFLHPRFAHVRWAPLLSHEVEERKKREGIRTRAACFLPLALHMGPGGSLPQGTESRGMRKRVHTYIRVSGRYRVRIPRHCPPSLAPSPCCVHLVAEALSLCSHVVEFEQ